jgi:transposase
MNHMNGLTREQITMFPEAIEDYITAENPVRFLDAFIDQLDTIKMGFCHAQVKETGRPPYNPKDLLKLYLYGYLNRIRTSGLLERKTQRNLEVSGGNS